MLDQYAPARHSASVASYAACRRDLIVSDGSYTNDRSDTNLYIFVIQTHYGVGLTLM